MSCLPYVVLKHVATPFFMCHWEIPSNLIQSLRPPVCVLNLPIFFCIDSDFLLALVCRENLSKDVEGEKNLDVSVGEVNTN
jgi:hypothetical protein